jgi:hypothetical protein
MKGLKASHQQNSEKFGVEAGDGHITHNALKD